MFKISAKYIPSINAFMVNGTQSQIDQATELCKSLDLPANQVVLRFLIIETSNSDDYDVGFRATSVYLDAADTGRC